MDINFSFFVVSDEHDAEFMTQTLQFFLESDFCPDKYNYSEPINKDFNAAEIPRIVNTLVSSTGYSGGVLLRRKKKIAFYLNIDTNTRNLNEITGTISLKKDDVNIIDFITDSFSSMFLNLNLEYGYMALVEEIKERNEYEKTEVYPSGYTDTGMVRGGIYLEDGFPGLYWLNYLGKKCKNYFGHEKLRSCPAYRIVDLDKDKILIQLYESPGDFSTSDIHDKAIEHLGETSFFDNQDVGRQIDSAGVIVTYEPSGKIQYLDE